MAVPLLAALLGGMLAAQLPPAPPSGQAPGLATRAPESDAARLNRLKALVEAAEKALEADDEELAAARTEEADLLTTDWPTALLRQPEVQALLQRLKEVQELLPSGEPTEDPGLKAQDEVVSIRGDELRAELERVRAAEQGATYDFPIDLNDKVLTWVNLFSTTKRGFMENALGRASMYMPMIRQVFAEEGVPADLAYLAVIESGFRNEANSRAKAVGMWQFIRSTGRIYGLNGNAWVEERRDPVKATRAAARYLKRLYEITGDWYLATSSYNAGPLTLERAIQNVGNRNFWDLARSRWLRTETKNYVPELCATILIGHSPERYGLRIVPLSPYAYETVTVSSMTSLTVLARCAATDAATLKALNPELLRGSTPPGSYQLRVPPGRAMDCLRQLARMPAGKRLDFKTYTVRKGDTLAKVANRFKLTPEDLLAANDLTLKQIRPGQRLLVPPPPALVLEARDLAAGPGRPRALGDRPLRALPVMPGEGGTGVEPKPGPEPLPRSAPAEAQVPATAPPGPDPNESPREARQSGLPAPAPEASTVPVVRPKPAAAATRTARTHLVQKGDTLAALARKYGVDPGSLRAWNRLKGDRILLGQRLRVSPP